MIRFVGKKNHVLLKFALKTGLLAGTVYYTVKKGIWKDADTASLIYNELEEATCPYIISAKAQIPYDLPVIPPGNMEHLFKYYWNKGVKGTFNFVVDFPSDGFKETIMAPFTK